MSRISKTTGLRTWSQRLLAAILLSGQVIIHLLRGKIHRRNTLEQMVIVGPESLLIVLVTALFMGMVFTIQVSREFIKFGASSAIGGVLAISLAREMAPLITSIILAGRVGSGFTAEIGTMQVTEQIDALYMLKTDPVDYLVIPRLLACAFMMPFLSILSFVTGVGGGMLIANGLFGISQRIFLDSATNLLSVWDLVSGLVKAVIFGAIVAIIGSSWGLTTTGGAKGVGQSTTTAVVTTLLAIFITNFFLSWLMFQGPLGSEFQQLQ